MKEQFKKLDSDAKLLLNVEEGRSQPIKIELPLSAFSQDKDDCCKRLLTTLRIFVLLTLLVIVSWAAMILYTSNRMKTTVVIQDDETPKQPIFKENDLNEANAFLKKLWEENIKDAVKNDVSIGKLTSKNVDSVLKSDSYTTEIDTKSVDPLSQNIQDIVEKIENEEVPENIVTKEHDSTETKENQNEQDILPFISFIDSLIDPLLVNELEARLQDSTENIHEENENIPNVLNEESDLTEYAQNESEEQNSEPILINSWLDVLGINNIFTDAKNEFSEDSEEAANQEIDKILEQMIEENHAALDEFVKEVIETIANDDETIDQNKMFEDTENEDSKSTTENQDLVDSEDKTTESNEKSSSEEVKVNQNIEEDFFTELSDLMLFGTPTIAPVKEESTNQSSEEPNKTDVDIVKSTKNTLNSTMEKNIYLLMARRIEAMLGEYDNLLIWYYKHQHELEPLDDNGQLQYFTARLLFSKDITEFSKYSIFVVSLLTNDDYARDFSRLIDQSQPKLQTETRTQNQILNRLVTKSFLFYMYKEGEEQAEEIAYETIEAVNIMELKSTGIDVDAFLKSLEEKKNLAESAKRISDLPLTNSAFIENIRRHSLLAQSKGIDSKESADSNESKTDDTKESEDTALDLKRFAEPLEQNNESEETSASTVSPIVEPEMSESAEVSPETSSEESANHRQAFVQAMQRIREITELEKSSEETEENHSDSRQTYSSEVTSKESEETPQQGFAQSLQSVDEQEPIVQDVTPDANSEVDVTDDELSKRLNSVMEDVLSSKGESDESVDMNDFLTIYDGFDY